MRTLYFQYVFLSYHTNKLLWPVFNSFLWFIDSHYNYRLNNKKYQRSKDVFFVFGVFCKVCFSQYWPKLTASFSLLIINSYICLVIPSYVYFPLLMPVIWHTECCVNLHSSIVVPVCTTILQTLHAVSGLFWKDKSTAKLSDTLSSLAAKSLQTQEKLKCTKYQAFTWLYITFTFLIKPGHRLAEAQLFSCLNSINPFMNFDCILHH